MSPDPNQHSSRLDREERPDVDQIHDGLPGATGSGGGRHRDSPGRRPPPALLPSRASAGRAEGDLYQIVARGSRDRVVEVAERSKRDSVAVRGQPRRRSARKPSPGFEQLASRFDESHGAWNTRSRARTSSRSPSLLAPAASPRSRWSTTLQAMRRGGIYDHVGSGFTSPTDREWLFCIEKMLYDQALLMIATSRCARRDVGESATARWQEIAAYVLRDMTSPDGAFYSAEDADSEGEEGVPSGAGRSRGAPGR